VDGDVVMRTAPKISLDSGGGGSSGAPSRGRLHTVTMTLIDDAAPGGPATELTMNTDNIDFDNDTFLITTGGFTAPDGTLIPADQVPVKVRGEYEFDGRGLTLRWNDRDDRLELLEIAHGEELKIMHPSGGIGPGRAGKTAPVADESAAVSPSAPSPPQATVENCFKAAFSWAQPDYMRNAGSSRRTCGGAYGAIEHGATDWRAHPGARENPDQTHRQRRRTAARGGAVDDAP